MLTDGELLRRYIEDESQAAFTELVQRHLKLVHLAALRRVGRNAHSADDVTQRVFTDLARKAPSLKGRPSLVGWLHTGTRLAAAEVVRADRRRRAREEEAHAMHEIDCHPTPAENRFEPFIDEALDMLEERDRDAVLLHFFENRSFSEIGTILSLSADAARMRVNRSLERLRTGLAEKGIVSTGAALAEVLSASSSSAAQTPLAIAIASHALSHAGVNTVKSISLVSLFGTAVLIVAGGVFTVEFIGTGFSHGKAPIARGTGYSEGDSDASLSSDNTKAGPLTWSAPTQAAVYPQGSSPSFNQLPEPEKALIKLLWKPRQSEANPLANFNPHTVLSDLFAASRDDLLAKGWIRLGNASELEGDIWAKLYGNEWVQKHGNEWMVALTEAGLDFCRANQEQINSYHSQLYGRPYHPESPNVSPNTSRD